MDALGLREADAEALGLTLALGDNDADADALGLTEGDAETDADTEGETDETAPGFVTSLRRRPSILVAIVVAGNDPVDASPMQANESLRIEPRR